MHASNFLQSFMTLYFQSKHFKAEVPKMLLLSEPLKILSLETRGVRSEIEDSRHFGSGGGGV